jgi:hypothetical protein
MVKTSRTEKIERVRLFNLLGEMLYDTQGRFLNESEIHQIKQPPGLYIFKVTLNDHIYSGKLVVE